MLLLGCFISLLQDSLLREDLLLSLSSGLLLRDDHRLHDGHGHLLAGNRHNRHHRRLAWHGCLLLPTTKHWESTSADNGLLVALRLLCSLSIRRVRIRVCCYNKKLRSCLPFSWDTNEIGWLGIFCSLDRPGDSATTTSGSSSEACWTPPGSG